MGHGVIHIEHRRYGPEADKKEGARVLRYTDLSSLLHFRFTETWPQPLPGLTD